MPAVVRVTAGAEVRVLTYHGAATYLSTVLHVALARVLRERATGRRLACLWSDQGLWLSGLADGTVERLDRELADPEADGWAWLDEQTPDAAGEIYPGPPV